MTRITRPVSLRQIQFKYGVSLSNAFFIGQRISREFGSNRRASVPAQVIGRLFCCMVIRRVQYSSTTPFAIAYDNAAASVNPIGPFVMSSLLACVPLNGTYISKGEAITAIASDFDTAEMLFYITSGMFISDAETMKQYAQAQGVAFTPLNWAEPFVVPPVSLRTHDELGSGQTEFITIPIELRVQLVQVPQHEAIANNAPIVSTRQQEVTAGTSATIYDITSSASYVPKIERIVTDGEGNETTIPILVQSLLHIDNYANLFSNAADGTGIAIHTSGQSDVFDTLPKALACLVPIFDSSADTLELDALDAAQGTTTILSSYNANEHYGLLIGSAFTKASSTLAAFKESSSPKVLGNVDQRSGESNRNPASGTPPAQGSPRLPISPDRNYGQRGVPGLLNNNQKPDSEPGTDEHSDAGNIKPRQTRKANKGSDKRDNYGKRDSVKAKALPESKTK